MKNLVAVLVACLLLLGCVTSGPVISKSKLGNLEINVLTLEGRHVTNAELFLDGLFVGNLTRIKPIIHAKRGERVVRVECSGFKPYEKKITILGDPNHQVLNVILEKE